MTAIDDQLALLASSEPDLDANRAVLHWFLREVLSQEDLDTYEYVFDSARNPAGLVVDAAFFSDPEDSERNSVVLNLVELVATSRRAAVQEHIDRASARLLPNNSVGLDTNSLRELVSALGLSLPRKIEPSAIRLVLYVVAPRVTLREPVATPHSANLETRIYDKTILEQIARAVGNPAPVVADMSVVADKNEILETPIDSGRIFACPVYATAIARWPGIDDRTLFDLNVRLKLGQRRVRESLDVALKDSVESGDFLAFHNGLTVVCDKVVPTDEGLVVTNFSVVNGAQSVIAFYENREDLAANIRVMVKFAAVGTGSHAAREIAIRSNTQNPVTTRNLRALDARQLTLRAEFEAYPAYDYEIRPDARRKKQVTTIRNDDAAQLLCAVYNERPWLAVKRLVLFEQPAYRQIFHPGISAAHVVLVHRIFSEVQLQKDHFPTRYRSAWKLTALVGTYLVGQMMRVAEGPKAVLDNPRPAVVADDLSFLAHLVNMAAQVLTARAERLDADGDAEDDYKVDFKREDALRALGSAARRAAAGS